MNRLALQFRILPLIVMLLSSLLVAVPARANVDLSYFEIEQGSAPTELVVTWGTETETDTAAFLIKRGLNADPAQAQEIRQEPASGSTVSGADYEFRDRGLTAGQVYYYWLIELTRNNQSNELASKQATAGGGTATPTPTTQPVTATPTTQPATATPTTQPATATPATVPSNTPQPTTTQVLQAPVAALTAAPTTAPLSALPTSQPAAAATNPPAAPATGVTPAPAGAASQPAAPVPASNDTQPTSTTDAPAADASATQAAERSQNQDAAVQDPATDQGDTTTAADQISGDPAAAATATATPQMLAEAPDAPQAQLVRPTATPRPSDSSGGDDTTSSLLMVIGGGSLCAAALLVLVVFFVWRRR